MPKGQQERPVRREYHAKRDALRETSLVSLAPLYCLTIESS